MKSSKSSTFLLQGFKSNQTKFQTQIVTNSNKIITYTTLELKHFCHLQNLVKKDILKEKETYLKMVDDYVCNVD